MDEKAALRGAWRRLEADYLAFHTLAVNRRLHRVGVPTIALSVLVALSSARYHVLGLELDLALPILVALCVFYLALELRAAVLADLILVALYALARLLIEWLGDGAWLVAGGAFISGWIAQLAGHALEGNRPAFLQNAQHLWVAPLALAGEALRNTVSGTNPPPAQ